jgi:hypothetical protein
VHAVLQYDGACLRWASDRLRGDRETIMVAVAQFGPAIQFALGEKIDLDFDVARTAVQQDWRALEHCSAIMRGDKDIVKEALKESGHALEYAEDQYRTNKKFCLEAIAQDGAAYHHVCRDLKNDKDIVLAAVRLDGELLEHVPSFRLRDDADIVAAAVAQNGYALEHASAGVVRSGWRSDNLGIVVSAMEQRISAMQTVGAGNAKYAPSD